MVPRVPELIQHAIPSTDIAQTNTKTDNAPRELIHAVLGEFLTQAAAAV